MHLQHGLQRWTDPCVDDKQLLFEPEPSSGEILHEFRSVVKIEVFRPRRALTAGLDEFCPERRHEPSQVGAPVLEMQENPYTVRIEVAEMDHRHVAHSVQQLDRRCGIPAWNMRE